jgi:hypothetical protein
VKIGDIRACTQETIGGGKVQILLINLGPLRCLMPIGMEHSGECNHGRLTEVVSDMICALCIVLDVEMELLQVGGPLLMEVVLQLPLCLYELQRLVINVDDCLLSHNVIFPLTTDLYNGIHFLLISGVFTDSIRECITMVCHQMIMLSDNCTYNIVECISLNLKRLLQIR